VTRRDKRARPGDATDLAARRPQVEASGGNWRLRNWRLRTKLFVVLLIPALAVVALVGLRVQSDLDDAKQLAELAARGRVDSSVTEVVHQLQRERDLTVRYVAGSRQGDVGEVQSQRQRVDMAIGTLNKTFADSRTRLSPGAASALQQTTDRFAVLTGLRFSAEHSAYPADAVLQSYSELISGVLDISDSAAADIADPELSRLRLASNALAKVKNQMSVKRAILAEALAQGSLSNTRTRALLGAEAELESAQNDYRTFATPEQLKMYNDTVIGLVVDIGNNMVESALQRAENNQNLTGLDPNQWDTSATYTINLAHQVQQALIVQMQERTDALAAQARTSAIWDSGIVFGVLLVAGVFSVVIARSLLKPLRILRRSALDVAEHQLPEAIEGILSDPEPRPETFSRRTAVAPVPVFSREELGQVARAFDAVHGEAVRLAGQQAMLRENVNSMFVNLSRRSQDLVERQLAVLDRMEADEQDPDTLGGLFELDHLATRMRRNSENLLVLSGTDLGREVSAPVSADEIIGAALSEVEHYQRVELTAAPALGVVGEAVNDLVHVVSELLENATMYSGEKTMVTLVSSATEAGAWRIEITDHGTGMAKAEIDRTNARLANPPEVDVEVSRRMGLFVVASLAKRHLIDVRLESAEEGGLTATVVVPAALVTAVPPPVERPALPAEPPAAVDVPEPLPELPSLESVLEPGPPRRAPVVEPEVLAWPTMDVEPYPLDLDAPTERMPAFQDVLSRWFQAGGDPQADPFPELEAPPALLAHPTVRVPVPEPVPEPEPVAEAVVEPVVEAPVEPVAEAVEDLPEVVSGMLLVPEPEAEPEPVEEPEPASMSALQGILAPGESLWTPAEPEWPTDAELELEGDAEATWPALPSRIPRPVSAEDGRYPPPIEERPILSLSPDAVRERMTSLQGGVRRGRHARGDDNSTTS
jgi:signal transduction histidine kinase